MSRQRKDRTLGVVQRLRLIGIGEPRGQRALVGFGQLGRIDVGAGAVGSGQRQAGDDASASSPAAGHGDAEPHTRRAVLGEPGRHLVGAKLAALDSESSVGFGFGCRQRRVEPLAQHPELQRVEDSVHRFAIPLAKMQIMRADR